MKYRVRNDWVMVEVIRRELNEEGIALPDSSAQSRRFKCTGVGQDVQRLCIGDFVELSGLEAADYFESPTDKNLIFTKQANVIAIVTEE